MHLYIIQEKLIAALKSDKLKKRPILHEKNLKDSKNYERLPNPRKLFLWGYMKEIRITLCCCIIFEESRKGKGNY
jgi:hypothetical protein